MKAVKRLLAGILSVTLLLSSAEIVFAVENSNFNILEIEEESQENADIQTSGTVGDNSGFQWIYDVETKTLKVTGEDSVLDSSQKQKSPFSVINLELNKIVFENCKFVGNISYLCKYLTKLKDIEFVNCDMSEVTDMSGMFYHCNNLSSINLNGLDTGNVTNMSAMFYHCDNLSSINLNGLDTGNVTDMSYMFYYCGNLGSIDVGNWNTGNVTDMSYMFYYCSSLSSINASDWNTQNVTDMSNMFYFCSNLSSIDVANWNTGNVTDMISMFSHCSSLSSINVDNWDTENVTYMNHMFNYCSSLSSINIKNWNMRNVKDLYWIFNKCKSLDTIYTPIIISNWDVISLPDTYYDSEMNEVTRITSEYSNKILVKKRIKEIKEEFEDINLGPYALKGATIEILGYEVPLIDLEAKIELSIRDNIKIVSEDDNVIKVLIGFDQKSSANIAAEKNSTTYWSESYKEVKSMYQEVTGKKVDTTRLWNRFTSLRGKLKKNSANMVVGVEASLMGYAEFIVSDDGYVFSEGGVIASFDGKTTIRSYTYAPCYVVLGIEVGLDGTLSFVNEENKINPQITFEPEFGISAGVGIGAKNTYAQADAYGNLFAIISTENKETPFRAGMNIGARIMGYLVGYKLFYEEVSFPKVELYPNYGSDWNKSRMKLLQGIDVSNKASYNDLINSAQLIERDYLALPFLLSSDFSTASFVKSNAYPLNEVSLVSFDDDTMLLVWIDDNGEKTIENRGTLLYSYYDGKLWSEPQAIYDDGKNSDMPYVYSDGKYAYIVWQKSDTIFEENIDTSEMLKDFDLYLTVFDSDTQTFSNNICINEGEDDIFEFNHVVYAKDGEFKVAWIENTDNNVFQMSGENTLHISSYNTNNDLQENSVILTSSDMIGDIRLTSSAVYYSLLEESMNLYCYKDTNTLVAENISSFDCTGEKLFYSNSEGFYSIENDIITTYNIGAIDDFSVVGNDNELVLFVERLNSDFTKTLLYSKLSLLEEENDWSEFEVYSNRDCYIRNYSPIVLSDNTIYTAFNYLKEDAENDIQTSSIVVEQCDKGTDVEVLYADYDDKQLNTGNLDIKIGIRNNSSTILESFMVSVVDDTGNILEEQLLEKTIDAFDESELVLNYSLSETYNGEIYTIKVMPADLIEFNESDNVVKTTFECIHIVSDEWSIDVLPTPETAGIKSQHCEKCDKSFNETELSYLKFSGASLTLHDNLTINYKVDKSLFEESGYKNPYVRFVFNGMERIVTQYRVVDDKYIFDFEDIVPNQMNDIIYATLYAEFDGVEFASTTREYSVSNYCYNMLQKYGTDEYSKFRTLLVDILNYGEASQVYTNYNLSHLVTENLTDEQKMWATNTERIFETVQDLEYKTIENPTVQWMGGGLNLQKSVGMRFKISADNIENLTVKVTNDIGEETIITSDTFEATDGGYYVFFDGLNAGQMSDVVYLTVYDGEKAVSNTIRYSIESYAYAKQNSSDTNLAELVKAMMKYGDSAREYIN